MNIRSTRAAAREVPGDEWMSSLPEHPLPLFTISEKKEIVPRLRLQQLVPPLNTRKPSPIVTLACLARRVFQVRKLILMRHGTPL